MQPRGPARPADEPKFIGTISASTSSTSASFITANTITANTITDSTAADQDDLGHACRAQTLGA